MSDSFKTFSHLFVKTKPSWNILFQGGSLIKVKFALGIFQSNNINFFLEKGNGTKLFVEKMRIFCNMPFLLDLAYF